jgi:dual specificity phosphatase 12
LKKRNPKLATAPKLHEIIPGLYLGNVQAATDEKLLKQHGITSVLSVVTFDVAVPKHILHHLRISMRDAPEVDITPVIRKASGFINNALATNSKILVHCRMGKSRSATIVTAQVQKILNIGPRAAMKHVRSKRPGVNLNYGFYRQLLRSV